MAKKPRSTRRDFLKGKSAVDVLAGLPDRLLPSDASSPKADAGPRSDAATYLIQIARDAMACEFQVFLNAAQHQGSTESALEALDRIETLEDQLSVYREHSEVSQINQTAAETEVIVEGKLFKLLQQALDLHHQTEGAFDITAGPLAKVWGFHHRAGRFPEPQQIDQALQSVGADLVQLSPATHTLHFAKPGVEINLNAIGKGFALDEAAQILISAGVSDFLIHGGQSSILAHGDRQGLPSGQHGWSVALRHPFRRDQRLAEIWLREQALGTSGAGNQFFHFQGKRYGHVIDPRTGYPADRLLSATVVAPSATVADALSTAAFVMGIEKTFDLASRRGDLAVVLAAANDRSSDNQNELTLHTYGLDDDAWRRLDQAENPA